MLGGTEFSEFGEALKTAVKLINWRFSVLQGMFFSRSSVPSIPTEKQEMV